MPNLPSVSLSAIPMDEEVDRVVLKLHPVKGCCVWDVRRMCSQWIIIMLMVSYVIVTYLMILVGVTVCSIAAPRPLFEIR